MLRHPHRPSRRENLFHLGRRVASQIHVGQGQVRQAAKRQHLGRDRAGVADLLQGRLDAREVDVALQQVVAEAVQQLGLRHAVVTSVTRDDLPDGGAAYFAKTVQAIRRRSPRTTVEVLIPDFQGRLESLTTVLGSGVDVLNHNVETVPRLYPAIRPEANFERSLEIFARAKRHDPGTATKSGLMVGLGETLAEMHDVFRKLADAGCEALTVGQYLAPRRTSHPIHEFVHPSRFDEYRISALALGFKHVQSGPFVRSSYGAEGMVARKRS